MRVNYYVFPENVPTEEMVELAIKYDLDIVLDVPKDVVKQMLYEKEYIESIEEDVPEDWLVFSISGGSSKARELLEQYKQYPITNIDREVSGLKITEIKKLLKQYGGHAYSTFFNRRDGEFYGCSPIELSGQNQRVGYKVKA